MFIGGVKVCKNKVGNMIGLRSVRTVADNTGVEKVRCIGSLKGKVNATSGVGDRITVSVRPRSRRGKVGGVNPQSKGSVLRGLIVGTRKEYGGSGLGHMSTGENRVVLLSRSGGLLGTRLKTPVPSRLRSLGYLKVVSLGRGTGVW